MRNYIQWITIEAWKYRDDDVGGGDDVYYIISSFLSRFHFSSSILICEIYSYYFIICSVHFVSFKCNSFPFSCPLCSLFFLFHFRFFSNEIFTFQRNKKKKWCFVRFFFLFLADLKEKKWTWKNEKNTK